MYYRPRNPNVKPEKLTSWDYAKVVIPTTGISMGLMGLMGLASRKLHTKFPTNKLLIPGSVGNLTALEAAVDIPITTAAMMKAQHDLNKKYKEQLTLSGLGKISEVVKRTPGVFLKGMPNRSGKRRMKRGLSITGVKM